jgi:D-alanyl-D-alanine dipeptidase
MTEIILMADPRVAGIGVEELGEPLVDLRPYLLVDQRRADGAGAFAYVRAGVLDRLVHAETELPGGVRLLVVEGYRPPETQVKIFEAYSAELRLLHPRWDAAAVRVAASRYVAPLEVAPHCAGAALDLTLVGADGVELDMGTPEGATPEESDGACYFAAANIGASARRNRKLLEHAMTAAGFVNYPTEWWHWSYGDRYWALRNGVAAASYAPVEAPTG